MNESIIPITTTTMTTVFEKNPNACSDAKHYKELASLCYRTKGNLTKTVWESFVRELRATVSPKDSFYQAVQHVQDWKTRFPSRDFSDWCSRMKAGLSTDLSKPNIGLTGGSKNLSIADNFEDGIISSSFTIHDDHAFIDLVYTSSRDHCFTHLFVARGWLQSADFKVEKVPGKNQIRLTLLAVSWETEVLKFMHLLVPNKNAAPIAHKTLKNQLRARYGDAYEMKHVVMVKNIDLPFKPVRTECNVVRNSECTFVRFTAYKPLQYF